MSLDDDVTAWIDGLKHDDASSVQRLWERYYRQLLDLAARKLPKNIRRDFDEEDVALSAIHSLCEGASQGRFPDLADRDSLWALLIVITARKCRARIRKHKAQKRGGGGVRGESAFADSVGQGIGNEIGESPTPEFVASMTEQVQQLLRLLPDEMTQQLAVLKMEGYTNDEASTRLGCSVTTIERRLRLIRKQWSR